MSTAHIIDITQESLAAQFALHKPVQRVHVAVAPELAERLDRRVTELEQQRQISASAPIIVGRALVVPIGLLLDEVLVDMRQRQVTEQIAMRAVMEAEARLGHHPRDVSHEKCGYDIESRDGRTGRLRMLEVKGRRAGADTITVTLNEIKTALNMEDQYALVIMQVADGQATELRYVWNPPFREPASFETSVSLNIHDLLDMSQPPT